MTGAEAVRAMPQSSAIVGTCHARVKDAWVQAPGG
jgi:hypothetical protein